MPTKHHQLDPLRGYKIIVILASMVIIFAGLKASSSIFVPFLMAIFIAIVLATPFYRMRRLGLPDAISFSIIVILLGVAGIITITILKSSLDNFSANLPSYHAGLKIQLSHVWQWLEAYGIDAPDKLVAQYLNPQYAMSYAGQIAKTLSSMLGQMFAIFVLAALILAEAKDLGERFQSIPGYTQSDLKSLEENFHEVRKYISIKSFFSLLTSVIIMIFLWFIGVENAVFLGLLVFFLNYIPTIGSVMSAVPGILLGFILLGPNMAFVTAGGYLGANLLVSYAIEPRYIGQNLGISPLIAVVSLMFWGWLLGPVGMLLSVPLTIVFKGILENKNRTNPLTILLGSSPD